MAKNVQQRSFQQCSKLFSTAAAAVADFYRCFHNAPTRKGRYQAYVTEFHDVAVASETHLAGLKGLIDVEYEMSRADFAEEAMRLLSRLPEQLRGNVDSAVHPRVRLKAAVASIEAVQTSESTAPKLGNATRYLTDS